MTAEVRSTVYIVDDDESVRKSLYRLAVSGGYHAQAFASAGEFLKSPLPDGPSCLVLDICMPGMGGIELQEEINSLEARSIPVVFITGHADVPTSVKALKGGAVDFLIKPVDDQDLLNAIEAALLNDTAAREKRTILSDIKELLDTLTPREKEVLCLVVAGMLNKQTAARLGIAEKTVKVHRSRVMAKMKARSLAELVRLAQEAGINSPVVGNIAFQPGLVQGLKK